MDDEMRSEEDIKREMEKEIEKEVERRVTEGAPRVISILIAVAITFVISLIVFRFVWGWVVPDLFPGAVAEDLIVKDLTWGTAFKLAVLVAALSGFYPALTDAFKQRP
ncbi:MAG: hypothetical protein ACE5JF_02205 [Anaerolineales bacterium]